MWKEDLRAILEAVLADLPAGVGGAISIAVRVEPSRVIVTFSTLTGDAYQAEVMR